MKIEKSNDNGACLLALEGKLDALTAPELQTKLIAEIEDSKNVVLDFSKLTYVSSAGLRVLVIGDKAAKAAGGTMTVKGVPEKIMEIFAMTGFKKILTFE